MNVSRDLQGMPILKSHILFIGFVIGIVSVKQANIVCPLEQNSEIRRCVGKAVFHLVKHDAAIDPSIKLRLILQHHNDEPVRPCLGTFCQITK
jgi:hypothetical protein